MKLLHGYCLVDFMNVFFFFLINNPLSLAKAADLLSAGHWSEKGENKEA